MSMSVPFIIVALTIVANFLIAAVVYFNNKKSATNFLLAALSIINAGWTLFTYLALFSLPEEVRLFWVRTVMFVTSPFGPLIFLLAKSFPKPEIGVDKRTLILIATFTLITAIFAVTPTMFTGLENLPEGNFKLSPGPTILLYGLNLIVFMTLGFITILKKFRHSVGIEKRQISYFLVGIIITFTLATITNFIAVVVFGTIKFAYIGPPLTIILVGSVAIAIIKHHLLDIRAIVARTVSYTLILLTIVAAYSFIIFASTEILPAGINRNIIFVVAALLIAFTFPTIRKFLEKATDKLFFKGRYDSQELLSSLTSIMASEIIMEELSNRLLRTLIDNMRITKGAFVLMDSSKIMYVASKGFDKNEHITKYDFLQFLSEEDKSIFISEELNKDSQKNIFRNLSIAAALPLRAKTRTIGLLILGHKASGDIYSDQDLELLEIFGPEAAVALQNAESYKKIQDFTRTLEKRVQLRTKELALANKRLKVLDKLKDDFVSMASHELRTPMTAIKSYLWMALNKKKQEMGPDLNRYINRSYHSTERLISLVNDMLNISRIESGRIALNLSDVDLVQLSKEVLEEVNPKADELKLNVKLIGKKISKVVCDKDKIHEVIVNLIGNSLKFTKPGGTISVTFEEKPPYINVSVTDTGVGMSKDDMNRLFKKFSMIEHSYAAASTSGGTGLGLYISKSIVTLHKGDITASSPGRGHGSTFTLSLPIVGTSTALELKKEAPKVSKDSKALEKKKLSFI